MSQGCSLVVGQLRAARALLGLSAERLADLADVSVVTIRRAETRPDDQEPFTPRIRAKVIEALQNAGVELLPDDEQGFGVRWREPKRDRE